MIQGDRSTLLTREDAAAMICMQKIDLHVNVFCNKTEEEQQTALDGERIKRKTGSQTP